MDDCDADAVGEVQQRAVVTLQSERQELSSSHRRLDVVVAEARRLIDVYYSDDTSKMTGDLQLITAHWQQLVDRYVVFSSSFPRPSAYDIMQLFQYNGPVWAPGL